jgi:hypothetical protein
MLEVANDVAGGARRALSRHPATLHVVSYIALSCRVIAPTNCALKQSAM